MKAGKREKENRDHYRALNRVHTGKQWLPGREIEILRFLTLLPLFFLTLILPNQSLATVGKPMITYSEDETASIQYSQYGSSSWATAATAATTTNNQFWKVAKTSPKGNKKVGVILLQNLKIFHFTPPHPDPLPPR